MFTRLLILLSLLMIPAVPWVHADGPETTVQLRRLMTGDVLVVTTDQRVYRLQIVDPKKGTSQARVSLDKGASFSPARLVHLLGASSSARDNASLQLVEMGVIRTGKKLEIGLGSLAASDRSRTEIVRAVELTPGR
jgi:hypothetical protein